MAEPFLGELKIVSFGFAPKGWAMCNGQLLSIQQNTALFALLGTTYGGNGVQTFALPNLQGRTPFHVGTGFVQGQTGGEVNHTLVQSEMPAHTHAAKGNSAAATATTPVSNVWGAIPATTTIDAYSTTQNGTMAASAVSSVGGSLPHNNLQPYLVVTIVIALTGIFPSRN